MRSLYSSLSPARSPRRGKEKFFKDIKYTRSAAAPDRPESSFGGEWQLQV